jgi:hypothetical protein
MPSGQPTKERRKKKAMAALGKNPSLDIRAQRAVAKGVGVVKDAVTGTGAKKKPRSATTGRRPAPKR